ncbi:MAG: TonB-dependent receptor [Bacteroidales bacterium]|nr:TonB-dependent receptor [Bacteroidales bacterium]
MKRFLSLILLICAIQGSISAQQTLELKRVGLDSLVHFLRSEINPKIYYISTQEEQSTFSVKAERDVFLDKALAALAEKGYKAVEFDGGVYILHSRSFSTALPSSYFDEERRDDAQLRDYLAAQNMTVTYQNKIYEVGDYREGRSGKAYVTGYIRDVNTGEPITGVSVFDERTGSYAVTDNAGFYRILLPIGDNIMNFSGYSLEEMKLNVKVYDNGGLDVVMKEKVTALKGATITAENMSRHRDPAIGVEKLQINTINKVPVAFGEPDVLKVVLTLPGVKSVGEAANGFNVRGGSSDQNLILFNDGTIYNPNHMFGIMSAFNSDVIGNVELYKSSIPAEYGGRISSVLDIRGREGNSKKLSGSVGIGVLTSHFHLEGPVASEKTTFILGGRVTYSNWILRMLPANSSYSGGKAFFGDANLSVTHHFDDKNTIQANAYWSADRFSFTSDTTYRYSNLNASIKWRSNFSDNHHLTFVTGYDRYDCEMDNAFNPRSGYSVANGINQVFAKLKFESTLNEHHTLSYGLDAVYYMLNPGVMKPLQEDSFVKYSVLPQQTGLQPSLYLSDHWRVSDKLDFDLGVRGASFLAMNPSKFYANPELRLSAKYSFLPNLSVKAGFNSMNQYIHLITNTASISPMDTWQLSTDKIRPQTGWQAAAGVYWTVADGKVDLSLDGYYKSMNHMLDYKSGAILLMNENLTDDLVETVGKAYGVEFMVKKSVGKLNGWLSYTYSRSMLREAGNRGVNTINGGDWYAAPHDKPHDFKLVANYKFTHRFSVSVNVDYSTGRPVTIPVGLYNYGGGMRLAYSSRNGYRIPDYFRMDLAMSIEPGHYLKKLTHMSVTFGVYNVTGRKNAYSVYFTANDGVRVSGYKLSVFACPIPYLNLNLKF